ncbi:hypothetical protein [Pseudomonas sp. W2-17]|uniref:hypothetical protein n=1 Tax=Pseudomonas sp. W2-17 TaxID=3058039 RepID=UPI0034E0E09E
MIVSNEVVAATALHIQKTYTPGQVAELIRLISPASPCALMTPKAFERVVAFMSCKTGHRAYSSKSLQAARLVLVLVMGASVAEAAAELELSRQMVHRLMVRIRARLDAMQASEVTIAEGDFPPAAAF